MANELTVEVRGFIANYVDSLEHLEILALMSGSATGVWTVQRIFAALQSNPESIAQRLELLVQQQLAVRVQTSDESHPSYSFRPATPELDETVKAVIRAFRERRVTITELIFSKPPAPLKGFADAFRIRKENPNG